RSMGSSAELNESSFQKRLLAYTRWSPAVASMTGIGAYDERDVYKPYAGIHTNATPQNFADSKVSVLAADGVTGENTDFATGIGSLSDLTQFVGNHELRWLPRRWSIQF